MFFSPGVRKAHRSRFFLNSSIAARLMTIVSGLGCMLWLSTSVYMFRSKTAAVLFGCDLRPGAELAWTPPEMDGQMSMGFGDLKVNIEAYNKKRVKDIALESRKLVSLAQSLKLDLQLAPESAANPNSIRKADEIQKLAHEVKESMKLNLVTPQ